MVRLSSQRPRLATLHCSQFYRTYPRALFEKSRARNSRCCGLSLLWADTLNRDNLWYPSLVDMKMNISTTGNVNLNMSDDWDKTINKNLEQLIIPQASVPYKVMQRADSSVLKY